MDDMKGASDEPDISSTGKFDCTDAFTTDVVFPTRDACINWARDVGRNNGIVVIIMRSDNANGRRGRKTIVILGCERSGKYRSYKNSLPTKLTGTRKCGCPFRLRARPLTSGEGWIVKVMCGLHNHDLAATLVGHPYVGRLSVEEKGLVAEMTKNMVKPRTIMLTLQDHNPKSCTSMKQVYNARQQCRREERHPRTEMQHLMQLMVRDQYVYYYRKVDDSDVVRDIFWTHPDAITLLKTFHIVLLIDSTYKTNKYRLPLLEIVGVTSTEMTFSVAFAYLECERVDNVAWAMEQLRGLLQQIDATPQLILTDRDIALMNALQVVFPTSYNLLCRFHIAKNVNAKCKLLVKPKELCEPVMDAWDSVVNSPNEDQFVTRLIVFEKVCSCFPDFCEYVKNTWLNPYKEKFVTAWVDRLMHMGNTTTNRVEAAHWRLKMLLQDSNGDLCTCWNAMNNMLILQHKEIKTSFERSITVVEHKHNIPFYKHLRGFVSRSAISRIAEELERVNYVGVDSSTCGCTIRSTYGLPCACELGRYRMMHVSIPLEAIHTHWLKLHCGDQEMGESDAELTLAPAIDALLSRFDGLDRAGKIVLRTKLFELAFPDTTSLCPPPEKVKTKGAPKKGATSKLDKSTRRDPSYFEHVDEMLSSYENTPTRPASRASLTRTPLKTDMKYLHQFPGGIRPYIDNIVNVDADGNCGYRAIAALLGKGEDSWAIVRDDCFRELTKCQHIYAKLFNGVDRVHELKNSVLVNGVAGVDKWMTMPDMGYVIASRYNVVLIFLASTGSVTIFPLRGRPSPSLSSHRIITIGLVHNCHFVQVFLKADSPIPPTDLRWSSHCDVESRSWETTYIGRMQLFSSLLPKRNPVEPHYVDVSAD